MTDRTMGAADGGEHTVDKNDRLVILASSVGTVIEWYDFYLYGSLAAIISAQFFSGVNETTGFIFALMAFAAGFAVRPFGAIVFGRMGDLWGRKNTFLVTMLLMGVSTFVVGLLPPYAAIGIAAPIILVLMRLIQGLALGGEYGGAATYVAEHAPQGKRGYYTSFIQTTATLGLFLSLLVILFTRTATGEPGFAGAPGAYWGGWRVPFLVSVLLLGISVWIRLRLNESPVFQRMKEEGKTSKAPLTEAFGTWSNAKIVILALLGLTMGQAVIWYTGQFYALFFLEKTLKVDPALSNILIAAALALATPFFVFFGWLSDKIGRKKIIMAGCLIAALTYFPIFKGLTHFANPAIEEARSSSPALVVADPATCSFQFDPVGLRKFTSSCDVATAALTKAGVPYDVQPAAAGSLAMVNVGSASVTSYEAAGLTKEEGKAKADAFGAELKTALTTAGYPAKADGARINIAGTIFMLWLLVLYVTMVYGPIAAALVEMFPTKVRYTSMSLPYHIGNGWFGGFLPTTAFAMVAATGNIYYGLWYPIAIAVLTLIVGVLFVKEGKDVNIHD